MTADQVKVQYRGDVDVRDLDKNVHGYLDWKLHYEGNVLTIQNFESGGTFLQLQVQWPGAGTYDNEVIVVIYSADVDTSGIYEDSRIAIWGRPQKYFEGTNAYGGTIEQALLYGDFVEHR